MVIVRTTDGQKFHVPGEDEEEANGVPDNHILMVEIVHEEA